jgi:putative alpha-1,2-mannosidase
VIEAPGASADNGYIQGATLDGQRLSQPWIDHAQVVAGGRLVLDLGPAPSSWGAATP